MDAMAEFAKTAIPVRWSELVTTETIPPRTDSVARSDPDSESESTRGSNSAEGSNSESESAAFAAFREKSIREAAIREERVSSAVLALSSAVEQWDLVSKTLRQQWEERVFLVAIAIARKILQRELERTTPISIEKLREILELAVGASSVSLHLHPDDLAYLQNVSAEDNIGSEDNPGNPDKTDKARKEAADSEIPESLRAVCGSGRGRGILRVVADSTVSRGGCRLEFPHGSVEAGPESELQRVLEEWAPLGD